MKRILVLVLVLSMLTTLASLPANSATIDKAETAISFFTGDENDGNGYSEYPFGLLGDTDQDSKITIMDVTAIQTHIAKHSKLIAVSKLLADVNRDNIINIMDATEIQRYIAQLEESSDVNKTLFGQLEHTEDDMAQFDEIAGAIKEYGSYNGSTSFPVYSMSGIGITNDNDGHLYSGTYSMSYQPNFSTTGNKGSIFLSYYVYNEEVSSLEYLIEIRIYRGATTLDIGYFVYDTNIDEEEYIYFEHTKGLVAGYDKETGDVSYLYANQDTMDFDEYFGSKETYNNLTENMINSLFFFCNKEIEDYTDVRIEDLI